MRDLNVKKHYKYLFFALIFAACSSPDSQVTTKKHASVEPTKNGANSTLNVDYQKIEDPRHGVSAITIAENTELRLNFFGAKTLDLPSGASVPVINWDLPKLADYVELIRCPSALVISGSFDNLSDVDIGSASGETEARIFARNDFWYLLSTNPKCLYVNSISTKDYLDLSASSSSYKYYARSCVNSDRLLDRNVSTNNCSKMVASWALKGFTTSIADIVAVKYAKAANTMAQIDAKGRVIYNISLAINNAMTTCQSTEEDRQKALNRKQAINSIVGAGISIGATLTGKAITSYNESKRISAQTNTKTTNGDLAKSTISGAFSTGGPIYCQRLMLDAPSTTQGLMLDQNVPVVVNGAAANTLCQSYGQTNMQVGTAGNELATALNWLTSSANDFPRTCTTAIKLQSDLAAAYSEMDVLQEKYKNEMLDAESYKAAVK